ncbi:MAG: alpha/beta fold hydrolase [Acidobacteriota bacterium]
MPSIGYGQLRIHYEEQGSAGRPILFLHGNLASSRWWQGVLERLPCGWHGLALDLPGCGRSSKPGCGYHLDDLVKSVAAFADTLQLGRFHLAGHSMGGIISLQFCLEYPQKVGKLFLVDPVPAGGLKFTEETLQILVAMGTGRQGMRNGLLFAAPGATPDSFFEELVNDALQTDPRLVAEAAQWVEQVDRLPRLSEIRSDVLLLWGEQDRIIPLEGLQRTVSLLEKGDLRILKGVGHSPPIECPRLLANHLLDFLGEDEKGSL